MEENTTKLLDSFIKQMDEGNLPPDQKAICSVLFVSGILKGIKESFGDEVFNDVAEQVKEGVAEEIENLRKI